MVGIISNSNGRADVVSAAVETLRASGAQMIIHCGDIGGRHVLDALAAMQSFFVWGDRDKDKMGLLRYAQRIGVQCFGLLGELDIEGKNILVTHGEDKKLTKK